MRRPSIAVLAVLAFLCVPAAIQAQTECDKAFSLAEDQFRLGQFAETRETLTRCLDLGVPRSLEIKMRGLLARTFFSQDDLGNARKEIAALLVLDPTFEDSSSSEFASLLARVRREQQTSQVASVSKTRESVRLAPATVVVVTADEIQRRGYLDLEELLHDLPGFDISRLNGDVYSFIYQRGYRSENDRLLLLVDGVEQNEFTTNVLFLSRQFPLTNIDRVEVVYGPASTMYGANAYTGVISVITKPPEDLIDEKKSLSLLAQVTGGGYGSYITDVTLAGQNQNRTLAWSLTGSFQQSKERDLSKFDSWDYTYANFDYAETMRLVGFDANAFRRAGHCATPSPYYQCAGSSVQLTPDGERLVRGLDRRLIEENGLGFDDRAKNWSIFGKLRLSNLTLGLEAWRSQEGIISQYGAIGTSGESTWAPGLTAVYAKYSVPLEKVNVNVFTRYVQTAIKKDRSRSGYLHTYSFRFLDMWSLVPPCIAELDPEPVGCAPASPWVETVLSERHSDQIYGELNVTYESSPDEETRTVSGVAGFELAKSSIQDQIDLDASGLGAPYYTNARAPEHTEHTDAAFYAQGTYTPLYARLKGLRFVLASRFSYNAINYRQNASGYGTLITPRAGVVYSSPGHRVTVKAIYSEAFKDPPDDLKFSVYRNANESASYDLKPERVRNVEVSADWVPSSRLSMDVALYRARYSDVVALGLVSDCPENDTCVRYQNRDEFRVVGFQGTAKYRLPWVDLWANYTHTAPYQIDPKTSEGDPFVDEDDNPIDRLPVADIARHRWNLGIESQWRERLSASLRIHYVGVRKTGRETTDYAQEFETNPFSETDAHTTADAAVTWAGVLPNLKLQLTARNLFDKQYFDPGQSALSDVPRVLQAGRTFYLRLIYSLSVDGLKR